MSALLHPEHKAATILAFRPRGAATQMLLPDHQTELAGPAGLEETEILNRPSSVLREIGGAIATPVAFILMLQGILSLIHAL